MESSKTQGLGGIMICKKCGENVTLDGIECPQCGCNNSKEEIIVNKPTISGDIRAGISKIINKQGKRR